MTTLDFPILSPETRGNFIEEIRREMIDRAPDKGLMCRNDATELERRFLVNGFGAHDFVALFEKYDSKLFGGAIKTYADEHDIGIKFKTKSREFIASSWIEWHGKTASLCMAWPVVAYAFTREYNEPIMFYGYMCRDRLEIVMHIFERLIGKFIGRLKVPEEGREQIEMTNRVCEELFGHETATTNVPFEWIKEVARANAGGVNG